MKVNILLVDDKPEGLMALESILGDLGENLVKAQSGREALKHLLNMDFALIILDVKMPVMDGFETAALIRQRERSRHTPIIFLTAYQADEQQVFQGYAAGAVDYMFKPVVPEILRSKATVFVELAKKTELIARQAVELKMQGELEASLKEKEALLKEVHHRVKNNLQVICSLLNLQTPYVRDEQDLEIFRESQGRIRSMALVHEKIYQSKDLSSLDFAEYIKNLTAELFKTYLRNGSRITLQTDIHEVRLGIDQAVPLGLLINELITNAIKHAFPERTKGQVEVSLHEPLPGAYKLIVQDDGIGLPPGLDVDHTPTLGLQIVSSLSHQLRGRAAFSTEHGTRFELTFTEGGKK
jgi:two-component sensor histidine kinase